MHSSDAQLARPPTGCAAPLCLVSLHTNDQWHAVNACSHVAKKKKKNKKKSKRAGNQTARPLDQTLPMITINNMVCMVVYPAVIVVEAS